MEKKEKKGFWASLFSPKPCIFFCFVAFVFLYFVTDKEPSGTAIDSGVGIKEIIVLGLGFFLCFFTYAVVEKVVKDCGIDVQLTKVDDIEEIMRYNIMSTPAIVIDGKVVLKGKVPSETEVRQLLGE